MSESEVVLPPAAVRGQIVFSKSGRDKGWAMAVLEVEGQYLFLVDGKRRLLAAPKKKKLKHVQLTRKVINMVPPCGRGLQDADIRKQIEIYLASIKTASLHP